MKPCWITNTFISHMNHRYLFNIQSKHVCGLRGNTLKWLNLLIFYFVFICCCFFHEKANKWNNFISLVWTHLNGLFKWTTSNLFGFSKSCQLWSWQFTEIMFNQSEGPLLFCVQWQRSPEEVHFVILTCYFCDSVQ